MPPQEAPQQTASPLGSVLAAMGPRLLGEDIRRMRERVETFYGTKPKGTGLGLSQVFVFAETSGGRVYLADSTIGARFVIDLPEATS